MGGGCGMLKRKWGVNLTIPNAIIMWIYFGPAILVVAGVAGWAIGSTCGRIIFKRTRKMLEDTLHETKQAHPLLSAQLADISMQYEIDLSHYLETKKNPAVKSAEEIRRISREKRELAAQCKMLKYQINFYEELFPWLEDFKEITIQDAIAYAAEGLDDEYDNVNKWLSPSEYKKLQNSEKYQLALNRWKERRKTAWDIGIEYERYVGYLFEVRGFKVKYLGATLGIEDMGRDLLATKDGQTFVIQCKRWSKEKVIHEKHICQLFGSVAVLECQAPGYPYNGLFVTTTSLSNTAKKCADYLGVDVIENLAYADYPMIKCNVSKSGERIYHLPFDQQYDKVDISGKKEAFYAWTTAEAESKGFRRAHRWHPDS